MTATDGRVLRWGLLGTARINRAVIPAIRAAGRHALVAVASRSAARADAYAAEWGIGRAHAAYESLLADPDIDVVYIGLPNALHAEWAIAAVEAGKHVLCEKPLATRVADVDAIAAAAVARGRTVAEGFMYRHHPQTALLRQLVDEGAVGEVRIIRGAFRFVHSRAEDVRWLPELGGGCLWDVGCYPVSYARWVLRAEPIEVFGWQRLTPGGVDETFVGHLLFPGGVIATIDSSFRSAFATSFEVAGTAGSIRVTNPFKPGDEASVIVADAEGRCRTVAAPGQELFVGEVEDMARVILDGEEPRISLADSRGNVAALAALYESARIGRAVALT